MERTEERNPLSMGIDTKSTIEILRIMNDEDKKVPYAVEKALPRIQTVVDDTVDSFRNGGRLFYAGAGTSGRLGVLDASECPPTFGVDESMVQGIIAGGERALTHSVEWAEDNGEAAVEELKKRGFSGKDTLVGISANGNAPYVIGAMKYALSLGAHTAAICSNSETAMFNLVDESHRIFIPVGPEIVTGSTRLKSGTGQKLVLNMITTASMIRIGKVYNNLMVDMKPVNAKLIKRAERLIREVTGCSEEKSIALFEESGGSTKTAITMELSGLGRKEAETLLEKCGGSIRAVIEETKK
jgi:N-acetylmuramic acid 6-phosphate etherase